MAKRKISEYLGIVIILLGAILLFLRYFLGAAILFGGWYVLYGFVGLAYFFSTAKNISLSNFFLRITFFPTLLPFRKALYFWTKSVNTVLKNPNDGEKAYALAKKVNVDKLYTDNNKAMFYSYLASLHSDLGNKILAEHYIQIARNLPHKKILDEAFDRVYDVIIKKE